MPAHQRVSAEQITAALVRWRGNVSAAAQELGVASNNVRKRVELLGIDLAALRPAPARRRRPVVVRPDHADQLTEAKFDFQALLRRELTENDVLHMFLDEGLAAWIERKIEDLRRSAATRPAKAGTKP